MQNTVPDDASKSSKTKPPQNPKRGTEMQKQDDVLFGALPTELEEKILYGTLIELFYEKDMEWRDVADAVEDCPSDGERIDVIVRWIDSQSYDEDWKSEVPVYVLTRCL
tara:strand:+ start:463 stop:789 length:327 start_codon:yes stop_codon:yes gene_type:complete